MTNVLFICKYNRFRSKVAEAYFKKITSEYDQKFKAKSAGIIKGSYPLDSNQKKIAKKMGIEINNPPQGLSVELLRWTDIIVIVADNVPQMLFRNQKRYGKRVIHWNIADAHHTDINGITNRIKMIKAHVDGFVKLLLKFD
jgi:protein-tyrosine-phosphatase